MLRLVNDLLQAKGLMLRTGSVLDATLITAPRSTKSTNGAPNRVMKQTSKEANWCFGMKAQMCVDTASGLVHTDIGTTAQTNARALRRPARG